MSLAGRLDRLIGGNPRLIIGVWVVLLLAAAPFSLRQSSHLSSGGYAVGGSQSAQVEQVLARDFPNVSREYMAILLWPKRGARGTGIQRAIERVQRAVHGVSGIELQRKVLNVALFSTELVAPIVLPLEVSTGESRAEDIAQSLRSRLRLGGRVVDRVEVHIIGESGLWAGLNEISKQELARAETFGIPILFVVLLLIFGSVWAASLPILLGVVAVAITGAAIYFLSFVMQLSVFVTDTASMLGLGVAVDYSLIMLARVRQELRVGLSLPEARRVALETSGKAVIFSGVAVVASLAGAWVIKIGTLHSMAVGAMLVVLISVSASLTLLPALITVLGADRVVHRIQVPRLIRHGVRGGDRSGLSWRSWAEGVMRHPYAALTIGGGLLVVLCIPALSMHTNTGALDELPVHSETRVGFTEAVKLYGPGSLGPAEVLAVRSRETSPVVLRQVVARIRRTAERSPHVKELGPTSFAADGSSAVFTVTPTVNPESAAAARLVRSLRESLPRVASVDGVRIAVGGIPGSLLDEQSEVSASMWKLIATVLLLAFCVLVILLRSLLVPVKAIVMNLLSVGAAYGVLVVVFQWGWLDAVFGYQSPGYVDTLIPPVVLAVVFGISMDYEIFLLTRIRERWPVSSSSQTAIAEGLVSSAGTISGAALVLVCVFAVFAGTGLPAIKEIGVGAAVAIALDATIIRLLLVPVTMSLLGEWNWWLPAPFARWLPRVQAAAPLETTTQDI